MKTWLIGFAVLAVALGAVITADQMGLLRPVPGAQPSSPSAVADGPERSSPAPVEEAPTVEAPDPDSAPTEAAANGERLLRAPSPSCSKAATPITLGHAGVVEQAGIRFATARTANGAATIPATGRIVFPTDRHAALASRATGIVASVAVDLGQEVEAGTELVAIDSAELGTVTAQLRQALAQRERWRRTVERQQQLREDGIGNAEELTAAQGRQQEAEAAVTAARQALRNLGLAREEIAAAASGQQPDEHLRLRAPFAGTVIAVEAAPGESCERGEMLVTIADASRVWALLDVPERDLRHVRLGQNVPIRSDLAHGPAVTGTVSWIAPTVDARTRTVPVRVEIDNADGSFRAGQFITAAIPQAADENLVLVPRSAVQWDGCCNVVFVPGASDREFVTRKIQVDHQSGDQVAVASGVEPDQRIVTEGSWLLKTEILKGSIGAGCCEVR